MSRLGWMVVASLLALASVATARAQVSPRVAVLIPADGPAAPEIDGAVRAVLSQRGVQLVTGAETRAALAFAGGDGAPDASALVALRSALRADHIVYVEFRHPTPLEWAFQLRITGTDAVRFGQGAARDLSALAARAVAELLDAGALLARPGPAAAPAVSASPVLAAPVSASPVLAAPVSAAPVSAAPSGATAPSGAASWAAVAGAVDAESGSTGDGTGLSAAVGAGPSPAPAVGPASAVDPASAVNPASAVDPASAVPAPLIAAGGAGGRIRVNNAGNRPLCSVHLRRPYGGAGEASVPTPIAPGGSEEVAVTAGLWQVTATTCGGTQVLDRSLNIVDGAPVVAADARFNIRHPFRVAASAEVVVHGFVSDPVDAGAVAIAAYVTASLQLSEAGWGLGVVGFFTSRTLLDDQNVGFIGGMLAGITKGAGMVVGAGWMNFTDQHYGFALGLHGPLVTVADYLNASATLIVGITDIAGQVVAYGQLGLGVGASY